MEMEMERRGMEMDSENHQAGSVLTGDTRGKHRILAELKRLEQETRSLEVFSFLRLEQETRSLEEELEELEKTEKVSAACRELLLNVDARPDPLLPETHGPANPFWDRWFEGPQDSQGCRCWVL